MLLTIFRYGNGYATYQLPPSFEALHSQLLPPASALDIYAPRLLPLGMNNALAPRPSMLIQSTAERFFSSFDLPTTPPLLALIEEES